MVQTRAAASKSLRGRAYKVLHFSSIPFLAKPNYSRKKSHQASKKRQYKKICNQNFDYKFQRKRRPKLKSVTTKPPSTPIAHGSITSTPIKTVAENQKKVAIVIKYLAMEMDVNSRIASVRVDEKLSAANGGISVKNEFLIALESFYLSCLSDPFDTSQNYVGMIFYGTYNLRDQTTCPGYVLMKNSGGHELVMIGAHGNHSRLYGWITSNGAPGLMYAEGFSYHCGQFKWKSLTLNGSSSNTSVCYPRVTEGIIHVQITQLLEKFLRACWVEKSCESPMSVNQLLAE